MQLFEYLSNDVYELEESELAHSHNNRGKWTSFCARATVYYSPLTKIIKYDFKFCSNNALSYQVWIKPFCSCLCFAKFVPIHNICVFSLPASRWLTTLSWIFITEMLQYRQKTIQTLTTNDTKLPFKCVTSHSSTPLCHYS